MFYGQIFFTATGTEMGLEVVQAYDRLVGEAFLHNQNQASLQTAVSFQRILLMERIMHSDGQRVNK